jgi:hypothetical protein
LATQDIGKDEVLGRIDDEQYRWRALVDEVGPDRMETPGPMGEWTFKDLAAHLLGWRERTIGRLEAVASGGEAPPTPWPQELDDDDAINDWIHDHYASWSVGDVLRDVDRSYARIREAVRRMSDEDVVTRRLDWLDGQTIAQTDLFGHLHDEHDASIRAWLAAT